MDATAKERAVYNMRRYGGGFISALAEAYRRADLDNRRRIEEAFPEAFEQYARPEWGEPKI